MAQRTKAPGAAAAPRRERPRWQRAARKAAVQLAQAVLWTALILALLFAVLSAHP